MTMPNLKSRYTIVGDNVSGRTRTADLEYEFKIAGRIRELARDKSARCALIEYERSSDADYAWRKLDGIRLDGRDLHVDYASQSDYRFFGWKWTEGESPKRGSGRYRSRSRTPSPSRRSDIGRYSGT